MENLTKLTGSFQRRLSCFLFSESGRQLSPPLSAPGQSIMPSPIMTQSATLAPFPDIGDSTLSAEPQRGGGESFSYSVLLLLLLLLPPFSTRASVPPHPPPSNTSAPLLYKYSNSSWSLYSCDIIPHCWGVVEVCCRGIADITRTTLNWSIRAYLLHSSCSKISL